MSAPTTRTRVGAYALGRDGSGRVLLCRMSDRTRTPGVWTLPGGGLHHGEHPEVAVLREVREETGFPGAAVHLDGLLGVHSNVYELEQAGERIAIHGVRLLYRVIIDTDIMTDTQTDTETETDTETTVEIRAEVAGSTDRARWFGPDEIAELELSAHASAALDLGTAAGRPRQW
ncbi:MAG TPA: NUDIX domain-containing protein [Actinopolymorphaceae bacterium]